MRVILTQDDPDDPDPLLRAAARGDQAAFTRLLGMHHGFILSACDRGPDDRLPAGVEPEDLAQEVFLAAYQSRAHARLENLAAFRLWLEDLMRNLLIDLRRKFRSH